MNRKTTTTQAPTLADRILDEVLSGEGEHVSLREAYIEITGDKEVTGRLRDCNELRLHNYLMPDSTRFSEAITASTLTQKM